MSSIHQKPTEIKIPLAPFPKPRMSQRDKWRPSPAAQRYRAWADALRLHGNLAGFRLPASYTVTFLISMPASWSKKQRAAMEGKPHQKKPDLDNLIKALNDALLPDNDSTVWSVSAAKLWTAGEGQIVIHIGDEHD